MSKLIRASAMSGSAVHASDGEIGRLSEFYFDDSSWRVRYLVAEVKNLLTHKKVLLAPQVVDHVDERERFLHVTVTREQVKSSPRIDTDKPIVLQHQAKLHEHYGWDMYWGAEALMGGSQLAQSPPREPVNAGGKQFDPHLRTTGIVTGYAVQATDGVAGRVAGFVLDVSDWTVHALTISLEGGETRSLPPALVRGVSFEESLVRVDATREQVHALPE